MNTDNNGSPNSILIEGALTDQILGAAFKVQNALGAGFLEKVYENAMVLELRRGNLKILQQQTFPVRYLGTIVGNYQADLIVEGRVVVECKTVSNLEPVHEAQLMNYLKAAGVRVGMLLNFGRPKVQFRRLVV
jgi:GxxExxY protein